MKVMNTPILQLSSKSDVSTTESLFLIKLQTPLDPISILSLEKVKFAFGISRGGMHTWLYSKGKIFEVHWDSVGDGLYEKSSLRSYPWISGAFFIPPDQKHLLAKDLLLKCG